MSPPLRCLNQIRRITQAAFEKLRQIPSEGLIWRANENDPRKHTKTHEGLFYILPEEKEIVRMWGQPSPFEPDSTRFYRTIGFMPLMVRQPALDAMEYIRRVNKQSADTPNVRILFYGDNGSGQWHTLAHLVHFLQLNQEHIIVHVRDMLKFTKNPTGLEYAESTSRTGRIDTPLNAALLLQQFLTQNSALLELHKSDLLCSQDYKWSSREMVKAGEPLINVAEHGINRVIHASDCVAVLLKELTIAADQGKIKLAAVLHDIRLLFLQDPTPLMKFKDHKKVYVDEVTVVRALKKLIKSSHKNGITLTSCRNRRSREQDETPREFLGIEGWNHFDPCLPIRVPAYSRKEFESCMNMYQDVEWLCRPESRTYEVREEIRFVSGMNPLEVRKLCNAL